MKLLLLIGVLLLIPIGAFYYVHSTDAFGLADWRLEALLLLIGFGVPLGAAARAM